MILSVTVAACIIQAAESERTNAINESTPETSTEELFQQGEESPARSKRLSPPHTTRNGFVAAGPTTAAGNAREDKADDKVARVRALVEKLRNEHIVWDGGFFGLHVREKSDTAQAILKHGKEAIPALYEVLDNAKQFAAAHALLTLIDGKYKRTAGAWNGLHVKLHADGRQELFPRQIPDIKAIWSRTLKRGVGLQLGSDIREWNVGTMPTFTMDVHNYGPETLALPPHRNSMKSQSTAAGTSGRGPLTSAVPLKRLVRD